MKVHKMAGKLPLLLAVAKCKQKFLKADQSGNKCLMRHSQLILYFLHHAQKKNEAGNINCLLWLISNLCVRIYMAGMSEPKV